MIGAVGLALRSRRRRILGVIAFGGLFLLVAATLRLLGSGGEDHLEMDRLFAVGGYPLVSGVLLIGWVLGRFPLIAVLALVGGIFSHDRAEGYTRLYAVRPVSLLGVYAMRFAALAGVAFLVSAVLMPVFDLLMIEAWAGPATFVLIAAYILVYGGLVALLSVWTRGDVWITLGLAVFAIAWEALRRSGQLTIPAGGREFISMLLPPQAALFELESAFGNLQPVPWDAFSYAAGYGVILLVLAGVSLRLREY